jgi:hypothetical protein
MVATSANTSVHDRRQDLGRDNRSSNRRTNVAPSGRTYSAVQ